MKETDILTTPEQIRTWEEIQSRSSDRKFMGFCFHDGTNIAKSGGPAPNDKMPEVEKSKDIKALIAFNRTRFTGADHAEAFAKAKAVHPSIFAIIFHDFMAFTNWYNDIPNDDCKSYLINEFLMEHAGDWVRETVRINVLDDFEALQEALKNSKNWIGYSFEHEGKMSIVTNTAKRKGDNYFYIWLTPHKAEDSIGNGPGEELKIRIIL